MVRAYRIAIFFGLGLIHLKGMAMSLLLESSAFQYNQMIPVQYTCHGADISPPLLWKDPPVGAKSYVLMMYDPDAPNGTWVHWVWFNIPAALDHLDEGAVLPQGALSGQNSWHQQDYRGPCPPQGTHRYLFQLIALDTVLTLDANATREEVMTAVQGHEIAQSTLIGLYGALA